MDVSFFNDLREGDIQSGKIGFSLNWFFCIKRGR
jgi:hypothetical protein